MVISGGVNIYPAEIEAALHAFPGVHDCAVFGIPDEEFGEALMAVVEPQPRVALDVAALRAHLKTSLADYKVPKHVEISMICRARRSRAKSSSGDCAIPIGNGRGGEFSHVSPDRTFRPELRSNRTEEALALEEDARLRNDIRLLGRILGDTVRDQEGADVSIWSNKSGKPRSAFTGITTVPRGANSRSFSTACRSVKLFASCVLSPISRTSPTSPKTRTTFARCGLAQAGVECPVRGRWP